MGEALSTAVYRRYIRATDPRDVERPAQRCEGPSSRGGGGPLGVRGWDGLTHSLSQPWWIRFRRGPERKVLSEGFLIETLRGRPGLGLIWGGLRILGLGLDSGVSGSRIWG